MEIDIKGYSERGVMNALFYGIVYRKGGDFNGAKAIKELLTLANINNNFKKITFYIECSLSGFGDPDLVIIGKDPNGLKRCIFIEAKVSNFGNYDIKIQKLHHDDYMKYGKRSKYDKGHSSNLFFQLRLKKLLVNSKHSQIIDGTQLSSEKRKVKRKIGNNPIVRKLYEEIYQCKNRIEYVAILPDLLNGEHVIQTKREYGFDIHVVSWKEISSNYIFQVPQVQN